MNMSDLSAWQLATDSHEETRDTPSQDLTRDALFAVPLA